MSYFYAFLIGGLICLIAQVILDLFKLTVAHVTCLMVLIGSILELTNFYDYLIELSNAGALIPITSFGHTLAHSDFNNILDLSNNMLGVVSLGIISSVIFGFINALIFKPKG